MLYRKKPIVVEAEQFTAYDTPCPGVTVIQDAHGPLAFIRTKLGQLAAVEPGEWIVTEEDRSGHHACDAETFARLYEPVEPDDGVRIAQQALQDLGFRRPTPEEVQANNAKLFEELDRLPRRPEDEGDPLRQMFRDRLLSPDDQQNPEILGVRCLITATPDTPLFAETEAYYADDERVLLEPVPDRAGSQPGQPSPPKIVSGVPQIETKENQ